MQGLPTSLVICYKNNTEMNANVFGHQRFGCVGVRHLKDFMQSGEPDIFYLCGPKLKATWSTQNMIILS